MERGGPDVTLGLSPRTLSYSRMLTCAKETLDWRRRAPSSASRRRWSDSSRVREDMTLRMGAAWRGQESARMRMVGAELEMESPRPAGDDTARAGLCSLSVRLDLIILLILSEDLVGPDCLLLRVASTAESAVAAFSGGARPLLTTVMDDAQLSPDEFLEVESRLGFIPIACPEGEFSAVLNPAHCSLVDDTWGVMVVRRSSKNRTYSAFYFYLPVKRGRAAIISGFLCFYRAKVQKNIRHR